MKQTTPILAVLSTSQVYPRHPFSLRMFFSSLNGSFCAFKLHYVCTPPKPHQHLHRQTLLECKEKKRMPKLSTFPPTAWNKWQNSQNLYTRVGQCTVKTIQCSFLMQQLSMLVLALTVTPQHNHGGHCQIECLSRDMQPSTEAGNTIV